MQNLVSLPRDDACLAAPPARGVGGGRAGRPQRARARRRRSPSCSRGPCSPSSRCGGAMPTPRLGSPISQSAADRAGDLQRLTPVLELRIEWALTRGGPMPLERFDRLAGEVRAARRPSGWGGARVAPGPRSPATTSPATSARRSSRPWRAGTGRAAADGFGDVGWTYDRALMLSLLDDEEPLGEAIDIAREPRRRAARPARCRADARARPQRPARPARVDAREPGRAHRAPARGARAARAGSRERRDRRPARRLAADGRAPRGRGAAKLGAANRWEAARRASELGLTT